ncbi:MAG: Ig-like domain-containing protein [Clostridiales bacterium]|nr:Ig-like domain-containing protein [Clostridiales bacterium]
MIIETLAVPTIGNEVYTGYPIHPKFEESRNYYAMYPANGCIDATTYCITFVLRDASYYKWAGSALGDPVAETTFTIEKADNAWNAPPSIANWTYGNYREEINSPFSAPRFIEAGASVTYRYIESNEAGEELGEPSEEVPVDAGWYYLVAELSEGGNYKALTGRTHFEILQATNLWEVTPSITSWRFSEYDETVNRPVGRATSGETQFMFYRLDQDGERVGEGVASMEAFRRDTDGEIPAGSYLMYVWVDETRNYTASHAEVPFHVFKAYNQWTTTPTIVRWYYGQYSVENDVPKAVPLYGKAEDVTYSFYLADADGKPTGEEVVGNMNGFRNEDGKVPAGEYILVASLAASDDYEAMRTEILFSILQVNNYWEEAPNITRWNQGTYNAVTNAISGKAAYGQVTFTVKDADGNVQTDLASLKAGTYTLTASVEGTSDYTDLESTIAFVVFSPVGGDENVVAIVASILLGVACLGLISAFIALFIHYKKNYE